MSTNDESEKKHDEIRELFKEKGRGLLKFLGNNLVSLILSGIVIPVGINFLQEFDDVKDNIVTLSSNVENVQGNYESTNTKIWELAATVYSAKKDVAKDDIVEEKVVNLIPNDLFIQCASSSFSSDKKVFELEEKEIWDNKEEIIGTAAVAMSQNDDLEMKQLAVKDLEDQFVIFSYKEDEEDVLFYGKYNNENRWDDNCIINRYKNGKLTFIMDAMYINGKLDSYKQVFVGKNGDEKKVWYVSERKTEGNSNSGETWRYFKYGDYEKSIDGDNITRNDIMSVDDFRSTIPSTQEAYYNGYTSDGKFNDTTGNSYLVKYNESGRVIYLYKGKMRDGWPEDDTGQAWSLIWVDEVDKYYYYEGGFAGGKRTKTPKNWQPATLDEIKSYVDPNDFNCSLQGLFDAPI